MDIGSEIDRRQLGRGHRRHVIAAVRQTALIEREWASWMKTVGVSLVGVAAASDQRPVDRSSNGLRSSRIGAD